MKLTLLSIISTLALVHTVAGGKCGAQECSKDTPCCSKGFCNKNALYCAPFSCEPANSHAPESCWSTPHCVNHVADFSKPESFAQAADYKGNPSTALYVSRFEPSNAKLVNNQLELALVKQPDGKGFGATTISTRAIQYGTVTAVVKSASTSGGVVSSLVIRNDNIGDEIDFEFVGSDRATVQSNYYWHNELDYTKMVKSPPLPDTTANYITYQIIWSPDSIQWVANGQNFRTVTRAQTWDSSANAYKFPDSESFISFSVWDGGSGAKGTADWAGGAINWGAAPFAMGVKSISVDCYYKGNETTYTPPASA